MSRQDDEAPSRDALPKRFVARSFNMGKPLIDLESTGQALEELDRLEAIERARPE